MTNYKITIACPHGDQFSGVEAHEDYDTAVLSNQACIRLVNLMVYPGKFRLVGIVETEEAVDDFAAVALMQCSGGEKGDS